MAAHKGIAVMKQGRKFSWRIGEATWEFMQWPEQRLWRNGVCLSYIAQGCGVKLVEDAVTLSLGYEHGFKAQVELPVDNILLR